MTTKQELEQQVADLQTELSAARLRAEVMGVVIGLPEVEMPEIGFRYHVNVQLESDEARALLGLADALDRQQATLRTGRRITDRRHAAQWLFERLKDAVNGNK